MSFVVEDFQNDVVERSFSTPVLVEFWAEWCGPCKMLSPLLEIVTKRFTNQLQFGRVDIDKHPEIRDKFGITTIPTVKLFVMGEEYDGFAGAKPEYAIDQWIRRALPSRFSRDLHSARELITNNEVGNAQRLLMEVMTEDPDNPEARYLMALSFLHTDPVQADRFAGGVARESGFFEASVAVRVLSRLLRKPPPPDGAEVPQVTLRYHEGIEHLRRREYEQALEAFLEVARQDREHDNGGGRKACIAICKILDSHDPLAGQFQARLREALAESG